MRNFSKGQVEVLEVHEGNVVESWRTEETSPDNNPSLE